MRRQRGMAWLTLLACLGGGNAAGQAAAEYGGASVGASAGPTGVATAPPAHLPTGSPEDIAGANRRALEGRAGKDAAKVLLRSTPKTAWVRIDGKEVGKTPLLLILAPGVYQVEMEAPQMEPGRREVHLLPKETREVALTLKARYPTHLELSWGRH